MNVVFIMIFFVVVIAVLPFIKNVIRRHYQGNFLQKITWSGLLIILLAAVLIILDISHYGNFNDATTPSNDLKTLKTASKDSSSTPGNFNMHAGTDSIATKKFVDTVSRKERPLLDVSGYPDFVEDSDSTAIAVNIKNYASEDARNVDAQVTILQKGNGSFKILKSFAVGPERVFLEAHDTYLYLINDYYHNNSNGILNSFYFFLKINYTDEDGKSQPPLRKIYPIPYPDQSTDVPNLKDAEFYQVESFLVKNNNW